MTKTKDDLLVFVFTTGTGGGGSLGPVLIKAYVAPLGKWFSSQRKDLHQVLRKLNVCISILKR